MDEDTRAIVPLGKSASPEDDATQELALRPAEQVAAEVVRVLDLIAERLQLETPHPATARRVRGARTVPRDFVVSLIAAAEQGTDLPGIGKFDPAGAREAMESSAACRLVAERMTMLVAKLNYTAEARWAKVVADAMNAFTLASIFARDADQAELAAEVENLRRQLGRKGTRKKKKSVAKKKTPTD